MDFLSILLLTLAATADSFTIGFHYGVKQVRIMGSANLVISVICLIGTFLSMLAGKMLGNAIPLAAAEMLGALALIAFGTYMLIRAVIPPKKQHYTRDPSTVDKDHSNVIELRESVLAGLLLSINNIGLGICAGMAGVSFLLTPPLCAAASFLFIHAGVWLGDRLCGPKLSRWLEIASAALVLVLGILSL